MSEAEWKIREFPLGPTEITITKLTPAEMDIIRKEFMRAFPFIQTTQSKKNMIVTCDSGWERQAIKRIMKHDIGSPGAKMAFMLDEATEYGGFAEEGWAKRK